MPQAAWIFTAAIPPQACTSMPQYPLTHYPLFPLSMDTMDTVMLIKKIGERETNLFFYHFAKKPICPIFKMSYV